MAAEADVLVDGDSHWAVASSAGLGVVAFANVFRQLAPEVLLLLGDRYETLSAALAAYLGRIPIAHLHGGETTAGSLDDNIRHAITKFSRLHLVSSREHGQRVRQLGESSEWIEVVGAPGLENFLRLPADDRSAFQRRTGIALGRPTVLFTYHPATSAAEPIEEAMTEMFAALREFPEARIIATGSNADAGGRRVMEILRCEEKTFGDRLVVRDSLGQLNYMNALLLGDVVLGNSSSGLIEAPSAGIPTVNVGRRQEGRPRAPSVIDCPPTRQAVRAALDKALSPAIRSVAAQRVNPYAEAGLDISKTIVELLLTKSLERMREMKSFADLDIGEISGDGGR